MKSVWGMLMVLLLITACGNKQSEIDDKKVYYFYQPRCSHCLKAKEHIDKKHPDLDMVKVDITANNVNFNLFLACAKKFNIEKNLGTPLFCMGDKFIMGWSNNKQKQFDRYIQLFSKK
ncbi:MAG: hypothetical protein E7012_05655 [Alphaproteobacteria bacterium]|nr:hypothetical protein [Alphaproteobacteria bacterium]